LHFLRANIGTIWRYKRKANNPSFPLSLKRGVCGVALGRKNYLFAGSHEAAQNAAVIYSLLTTCKINNIEPLAWLTRTLAVISDYPANQLHKLLPGQK
jgi:hypothetical protein